MISKPKIPSLEEERILKKQGYRFIAGVDEVGRGALAGPVLAAAVILPVGINASWLSLVKDSKQLTPARREDLFARIKETAVALSVGLAYRDVVDNEGIVRATRAAMKMAVNNLVPSAEVLLIDYLSLPEISLPQKGIKYGDSLCLSIACASIVAKVTRDHMMMALDGTYPGYELAGHKGYGTRRHLACLRRLGPSPIHRRSFRPVRELI